MDNIVYNTALEKIAERFPGTGLIPLPDVAEYLSIDKRTLEARTDFPVIRFGSKAVVARERLAFWLANA